MKQHPGEGPLYVDGQGLASCPGSAGGLASCLKPLNMGGPKIILAGLHVILLAAALTALTTAAIAAAATCSKGSCGLCKFSMFLDSAALLRNIPNGAKDY